MVQTASARYVQLFSLRMPRHSSCYCVVQNMWWKDMKVRPHSFRLFTYTKMTRAQMRIIIGVAIAIIIVIIVVSIVKATHH